MKNVLRIGTRGSDLALWQARHVQARLRALPGAPEVEIQVIKTEGDRIQDVPLSQVAGKAFFTKEIEAALLDASVDLAVHSLKDLATVQPAGLDVAAVLEREDPRDALLTTFDVDGLDGLPKGARVGTSSLRRRALLLRWRPDLELMELRGNVPTRIEKMERGEYDAIVLAAAGVKRLGLGDKIRAFLAMDRVLPAVSQGAMAVQIRETDADTAMWVRQLDHEETHVSVTAERALLRRLEGGCQVPVGGHAVRKGDALLLKGVVCSLDGTRSVEGEREGSPADAAAIGLALAEELLQNGAGDILGEIRLPGAE
ncbi:MAG: hydroxymethylbilane synthase [Candidatus Eisenbacteria bacterium]|uniref:Porphobilinogen deaminase n=1 Tax=Eiseniibacteriota bacterium TaxID=2212470 RepID=A0A956SEJ0_UNCEI|nr:hydroxymethylbilane synthase [Candidatus Eisenbacteria bacterium]MCB9462709.1 hydroxymethylbilane synthase [Candidatus Eisenbacteria bacterium]